MKPAWVLVATPLTGSVSPEVASFFLMASAKPGSPLFKVMLLMVPPFSLPRAAWKTVSKPHFVPYPKGVTEGAGLTGWEIVNGNAANNSVLFPATEYSMLNEDGGDGVLQRITCEFANPLPAGSVITVSGFDWVRNAGLRTRAVTAFGPGADGVALPPTTLVGLPTITLRTAPARNRVAGSWTITTSPVSWHT